MDKRVTVSLVEGSDLAAAVAAVTAAGMHVEQALEEVGVLIGRVAEAAMPALVGVAAVEHVEAEGVVQIPPPGSSTQ
jgi:hypothetical protein